MIHQMRLSVVVVVLGKFPISVLSNFQQQPKGNNYNSNGHRMRHLYCARVVALLSPTVEKEKVYTTVQTLLFFFFRVWGSMVYTLLSGPMVYTLFPCFPRKKRENTIAFFALRPRGRATDREKRGPTVVVFSLFPLHSGKGTLDVASRAPRDESRNYRRPALSGGYGLVAYGMAIFQSPKNIFQRPKFPGKCLKFRRKSDFCQISGSEIWKFRARKNAIPYPQPFHTPTRLPPISLSPLWCGLSNDATLVPNISTLTILSCQGKVMPNCPNLPKFPGGHTTRLPLGKGNRGPSKKFCSFQEVLFSLALL